MHRKRTKTGTYSQYMRIFGLLRCTEDAVKAALTTKWHKDSGNPHKRYNHPKSTAIIMINRLNRLQTLTVLLTIASTFWLAGCSSGSDSEEEPSAKLEACSVINLLQKSQRVINGQSCSQIDQAPIVRVVAEKPRRDSEEQGALIPICSGTVINNRVVLTAAHCFLESNIAQLGASDFGVLIGESSQARYIRASEVRSHPNLGTTRDGRLGFDVAAMLLESDSNTTRLSTVQGELTREGDIGYVYGYGQTEIGTSVSVNFASLEAGNMRVSSVESDFIIVKFEGSGTNVCNGDSGGPLVILASNNTPVVVGVVSSGTVPGCDTGDTTSFTNLERSEITNWINSFLN